MKFLIALLVIACLAYAQSFTIQRGEALPMQQVNTRIQLDDVKYVFKNLPSATRERLYSIVRLFGMSRDDVDQALENPPDEVKQMFGPYGMSIDDMRAVVNNLPEALKKMF